MRRVSCFSRSDSRRPAEAVQPGDGFRTQLRVDDTVSEGCDPI